jgi:dTDP-4-dehydrorhamnose reductase
MKILLLGAHGQLGADLLKTNPGHALTSASRADADVTDTAASVRILDAVQPEIVVNLAAFNRTEDCETQPDLALRVNALGPGMIARLCAERGVRFLQVSSDFVFDGQKAGPYLESDAARPLSVYGLSKFGGECLTLAASGRHWVVRTASLFGVAGSRGKGGNFVEAILKKARSGDPVEVVSDIRMSPTSTRDLAVWLWAMIDKKVPGGIYHAVNEGEATWWEFAREIVARAGLTAEVRPISSSAYPGRMRRPLQSVLRSERAASAGLPPLRPWRDALEAYLAERSEGTTPSPSR